MKRYYVLGASILAVGVLTFFHFFTPQSADEPIVDRLPTINVTAGEVTLTKDGVDRLVSTGEEISSPFSLKSNAEGQAIVLLPDGSELRLDTNSALDVREATFDPMTGGIVVHAKLTIGRVWSSIIALTTPESSWEVETSNVVATVRGTAFGIEAHENGDSWIIGSEHTVTLTPINPDTQVRDTLRAITLDETHTIRITSDMSKTSNPLPAPNQQTDEDRARGWVARNKKVDAEERERMQINTSESPAQNEAQTNTDENASANNDGGMSDPDIPGTPQHVESVPARDATEAPKPSVSAPTPAPKPVAKAVSLVVTPATTLDGMIEGATARLTATLTYSDGSTKDVSTEVDWGVVGGIGSMNRNIFTAQLAPNVSEFGKSSGSIRAIWVDPTSGNQLLGTTPIFKVIAKVIPLGTDQG